MEQYVNSDDLAFILNITARWVNKLALQGVIEREENGNFDVQKSVEKFFRHKFRVDEKQELDFDVEHTMLEKAKRKKMELELAQKENKLLEADEVEKFVVGMILNCKAKLLSMATAVAPKIIGQKDLAVVVSILKDAVYNALNELKEMPAEKVLESDAVDT